MKNERGGKIIAQFTTNTPKTYGYRVQKMIITQKTLSL